LCIIEGHRHAKHRVFPGSPIVQSVKSKDSAGLRELAVVCLLVAAGVVLTIAALWLGWDIGGAVL
jgi:hypothetical protein